MQAAATKKIAMPIPSPAGCAQPAPGSMRRSQALRPSLRCDRRGRLAGINNNGRAARSQLGPIMKGSHYREANTPIKPIEKKNAATKLMCLVHRSSPIGDRQRREFTNRSVDYLEKWLARNTTGRSAWAFSSKNLRDARSSITSRSRMRDVRPDQRVDQFIYKIRQVARDRISDDQTLGECTGPSDCGRAGTAGFRIVCAVWNTGTARFAGSDCEDIGNCDPAGDRIT